MLQAYDWNSKTCKTQFRNLEPGTYGRCQCAVESEWIVYHDRGPQIPQRQRFRNTHSSRDTLRGPTNPTRPTHQTRPWSSMHPEKTALCTYTLKLTHSKCSFADLRRFKRAHTSKGFEFFSWKKVEEFNKNRTNMSDSLRVRAVRFAHSVGLRFWTQGSVSFSTLQLRSTCRWSAMRLQSGRPRLYIFVQFCAFFS